MKVEPTRCETPHLLFYNQQCVLFSATALYASAVVQAQRYFTVISVGELCRRFGHNLGSTLLPRGAVF